MRRSLRCILRSGLHGTVWRVDGGAGFQIFMVQRHRRSGFLPNAWVFPGGRVDPGDAMQANPRVVGGSQVLDRLGVDRDAATAFCIAGVRETFEEAGIWLGSGELPWDLREPLGRGKADLAAILDTHDATIDLDLLHAWSWWITPEIEPKRYDTRFLVAIADGVEGRHDDREVVASGWFDPREVMTSALQGDFPMAPPTWWTLLELSRHADIASVISDAQTRPILPNFTATATSTPLAIAGTMYSTLYITLLSSAARTWDCTDDADGVSRLDDFPDIKCWEGEHTKIQWIGLFCTFFFIGIWVWVSATQYRLFHKHAGADKELTQEELDKIHANETKWIVDLFDQNGESRVWQLGLFPWGS